MSDSIPQLNPCCAHVFATHGVVPQTLVEAEPHVMPVAHVPQLISPLQPSLAMPQVKPWLAHVFGVHAGAPQTFGVLPPPHVCGAVHEPHCRRLPQLSPTDPQFAPSAWQVVGAHPPESDPESDASMSTGGDASGADESLGCCDASRDFEPSVPMLASAVSGIVPPSPLLPPQPVAANAMEAMRAKDVAIRRILPDYVASPQPGNGCCAEWTW